MADSNGLHLDSSLAHIERGDQRDLPVSDQPLIGLHDKEADERANEAYFRRDWVNESRGGCTFELVADEPIPDPHEPRIVFQGGAVTWTEGPTVSDLVNLAEAKAKRLRAISPREEFTTGSRRDSREGKGRYDLLPPYAISRLAKVYERGGKNYGDRNWEKGQPLTRFLDSALRHTFQVLEGKTDEDHAGHAAWNLLAFIEIQNRINEGLLPEELNDL